MYRLKLRDSPCSCQYEKYCCNAYWSNGYYFLSNYTVILMYSSSAVFMSWLSLLCSFFPFIYNTGFEYRLIYSKGGQNTGSVLLNVVSFSTLRWQKMISPSNWPFLKKALHLHDNTGFCCIIQASKLVFGSLLAKNNLFGQIWTKYLASSRRANCGSGLPAEWPFRSQNAIEASDLPLPGGLWVKRLITHALCSLAYSDIAWCKHFLILTMKGLY